MFSEGLGDSVSFVQYFLFFKIFLMRQLIAICLKCFLLFAFPCAGQDLIFVKKDSIIQAQLKIGNQVLMHTPENQLWSIATKWESGWPSNWLHANSTTVETLDNMNILKGKIVLPDGELLLQDVYFPQNENGVIKCIRRYEWTGKRSLDSITLSIRWSIPSIDSKPFLPGILYYGNPSGEKNGPNNVPWFHNQLEEESYFEEHRYPMPFVSLEWKNMNKIYGSALHTVPSPIIGGNISDQWWSLGIKRNRTETDIVLLTGPVAYNGQKNVVKALQTDYLPYKNTFIKLEPGTIIEKTFYLEGQTGLIQGTAFQKAVSTSIELFQPFSLADLPSYKEIMQAKYRFTRSRWVESSKYAGFNMFPTHVKPKIVLGWAGQSEAPAFALQVLEKETKDATIWTKIQHTLDHICTSPFTEDGFAVEFDLETGKWDSRDPVSQGQAMNNIASAIIESKRHPKLNSKKWETFLLKSSSIFAEKILQENWKPVNTAESFFIAPFVKAYIIFGDDTFKKAAIKIANYYVQRHIKMEEPYWGGTLDAQCEDKEGAWGAFQGLLSIYELTKDPAYLKYAKHACDVVLSYTVVWDIPMPAGRLADHRFKSRGWTGVSVQNQHLDVYGVLIAPSIYKMGRYLQDENLKKIARTMFLSCGQLIAYDGAQGEQIQQTNFAQHGRMDQVSKLRGGYSEPWTVYWITAHFLTAAAEFKQMGVIL